MPSRLLLEASKKGIHLYLKDGALAYKAPPGALTPELKERIAANKTGIIDLLRSHGESLAGTPPIGKRSGDGAGRLSFAQQRLWMLDQIDGGSAHYNMAGSLAMSGTLDVAVLNRAFGTVVARHESLRTCFEAAADGQPRQVVRAAQVFDIAITDLSQLPHGERQALVAELAAQEAGRLFDLRCDLMLRARLLKLAAGEHVLLVTMHHIASDGWSLAIFFNELSALYAAYAGGHPDPLPPLAIQYADYAEWQRGWLQGEVLEQQLGYWERQLAGLPVVHGLPLDHARPQLQGFAGATHLSHIDAATGQALHALCQAQGATLFMGLHATFAALLARYSNETDIVVGSPIANREQAEIAPLIGFFVNTLVLRSDLSAKPTFAQLLDQSKRMLLDAYAHQQVPFEQIVERLQPQRSLAHSPLFQVMLALQNNEEGTLSLPGMALGHVEQGGGVAQFDLTLTVTEKAQGLALEWEYNTGLFEGASIARMAEHFGVLLAALVKAPQQSVFEAAMLDAAARRRQLVEWNPVSATPAMAPCVHQMFELQAARQPDAIALVFEGAQLTYAQLNARANRLAHYLCTQRQVGPGSLVGVCVDRSLDMVVAILAVLKAGGAYVPLDPAYPAARLAYMLDDAELETVLTQDALRSHLPFADTQAVCLDAPALQLALAALPDTDIPRDGHAGQPAYVIYTSGSTGQPKGVVIEQGPFGLHIRAASAFYGIGSHDKVLQFATINFDAAQEQIFTTLATGATLFLRARKLWDVKEFFAFCLQEGLTVADLPPSYCLELLHDQPASHAFFARSPLRTLILGGEALSAELVKRWRALPSPVELVNAYGPTEAVVTACAYRFDRTVPNARTPIGRALAGRQCYVLAHGQLLPPGVAGELHLGGPALARGYLKRPELTAEKFIDNPFHDPADPASSPRLYRTGDLVRWLDDGNLEFLGRVDDQVKVRGFRIELGEIENALRTHPHVIDAAVLSSGGRLLAYVAGPGADTGSLRTHLAQSLPDYMVPSAIVVLDALPLTPNGKVDRKALPDVSPSASADAYVAPRTATEQMLCEVWQDVLGVERIGTADNFFQLGGHSLLVMQVIARVQERGRAMSVRQMFTAPTVAGLASAIDAAAPVAVFKAPPNLIAPGCQHITPAMLPLVSLDDEALTRIVSKVPGGAANVQDIYPLTPLQEGILFHHMMQVGSDPYVTPMLFKAGSAQQVEGFLDALRFLVARHEALRTAIVWQDLAMPVQVVYREAALPVEWLVLDPSTPAQAQMQALCAPEKQWMALERAPTLRLKVAADPHSTQHFVLLQLHHLNSDHVGLAIIEQELAAFQAGHAGQLPTPLPYREFVAHVQHQAAHNDAAAWFKDMLADVTEPTLPFGLADVQRDGSGIDEALVALPPALSARVRRNATQMMISPAALFHAAWAMVIAACSGRDDVVFGTVLSGRLQGTAGAEGMVGAFINTLPLRVRTRGLGAAALLRQVQDDLVGMLPYEQASLALAQRCSGLQAGAPLFSAILNYRHSEPLQQAADDRGVVLVDAGKERTNYPFCLSVSDLGDDFELDVQADAAVGAARIAAYMQACVTQLLEALETAPDAGMGSPRMLSEAELQQMLVSWNDTGASYPYDKSIHTLFEEQARARPSAVAVICGSRQLSYAQLDTQASRLAHYLVTERHVGPDSLVGICVERSLDMMVGILAILKAGGAYVPLDPAYPKARLAHMLADAQLGTVLVHGHLLDSLPVTAEQTVCLDSAELQRALAVQPDALADRAGPRNLAYVMYTSGSTGAPKGVMVEHRNVVSLVCNNNYAPLSPATVMLQNAPVAFDAATFEIWGALLNGGTVVIQDAARIDMHSLAGFIDAHAINTAWMTSGLFDQFAAIVDTPLPSLQYLLVGGDIVNPRSVALVQARNPGMALVNGYGPTENTTFSCCHRIDAASTARQVPIGKPLANRSAYILDASLGCVPQGVAGELHVGGAGLARGYLKRPDLDAEKFIAHPFIAGERLYKTGDLARHLPDGSIEFLGRIDHQVKIRGFRIETGEIEAALVAHPQLRDAAVVAREAAHGDKRLVAYVAGEEVDADALRSFLSQSLPDYMLPSVFVRLDALPLTANGKVDRKALPEPDLAQLQTAYIAPRTELEQALCQLCAEVLGIGRVGMGDNFFQLGGHSLLATRLVAGINQHFGVALPLKTLFQAPGMAELAQAVAALGAQDSVPAIGRVERGAPLLPSFAQQRLWMLDQIDGGSAHYNLPGAFRLSGILHHAALTCAFSTIIERHESLRTVLRAGPDGQPMQVIEAAQAFAVPEVDLRHLSENEQSQRVAELAAAEALWPFDLGRDLMLRATLLKLAADEHVLLLTMHHIASDGWSVGVFVQELGALYAAYVQGKDNPLPPLAIQYADYANWQRNWLQDEVLERQLAYWSGQLTGLPVVHSLPLDHARPAQQSFAGATHATRIDAPTASALLSVCQSQGATLFMGLHAAFATLLARCSNETDIVVGSPIANREQADIAPLIGFFVNTLVLRSDLSGDPSFSMLVERSKRMLLEAYAHQQLPFEQLVERLQPERQLAHSPLFQVMLVLQNNEEGKLELPGLTLAEVVQDDGVAKFDLTLTVRESAQGLALGWEYNTELFEAATIARLAGQFGQLLAALVAAPGESVFKATMLDEARRHQMLVEWNATDATYASDKCIHELFEEQASRHPNALALVFEREQLSYARLNARANALAHYLVAERNVGPDHLVGICVDRSPDMVVGILAVLKAGGAYVPLDPGYPAARLAYMLGDARLDTVLTQTHLRSAVPLEDRQAVCIDALPASPRTANLPARDRGLRPQHLAYAIYTSGSTGQPKASLLTHAGLCNLAAAQKDALGVSAGSRVLQFASVAFDAATWEWCMALSHGAALVMPSRDVAQSPDALSALVEIHGVTHATLPPVLLPLLKISQWQSVQTLVVAGDACSLQLATTWAPGRRFINAYGPSETTVCATMGVFEAGQARLHIGRPLPNIRAYVLSEHGEPAPLGTPGELHIGGIGLARGYLDRPALTAERFIDSPFEHGARLYRTGDLVRWLDDGNLEFLGRIDHQVKIRGFRIELGEIESALLACTPVQDAVVLAKPSPAGDKQLVAYAVAPGVQDLATLSTQLREQLSARLPDYMVPAAIVVLDALPLTPNGKVDRKALPEPDLAQLQAAYVAPRTEVEQVLCTLWQEVLGVERVGVTDNFFHLGGHSLLATRLVARVNQHFQTALPLKVLFQSQTLAGLAQQLVQLDAGLGHPPLAAVARDQILLPSYGQQRLWLLDQIDGGSPHYNLPAALTLTGTLDHAAMERAFGSIVARHESLRTCFEAGADGQPRQVIREAAAFPLPLIDLSSLMAGERQLHLAEQLAEEAGQVFDLRCDLMLRASLLKLAADEHVLLLTMHHIASDGWSMAILIDELRALYSAYVQGQGNPLPPLAIQYADYAHWQRNWLQGEVLERHLSYWTTQLANLPVVHSLSLDRARPQQQSFAGAVHASQIDAETCTALRSHCQAAGATLFMGVHAAFAALLSRYSNETDIVVGSPIANREQAEIAPLIGFFVNTLVLRSDLSADPGFAQLLDQSKRMLLDAYAHQQVPFEQIVERLQPQRSLAHSPLFQVMLVLQNNEEGTLELPGLTLRPLDGGESLAKYDLTLNISEAGGQLRLEWEYNTDLFDAATIARMAAQFGVLLDALVREPQRPVSQVPLLSLAERTELLALGDGGAVVAPGAPSHLHALLAAQAQRTPDAIAIAAPGGALSYRALVQAANGVAEQLAELGAGPGARVALMTDRSADALVGLFGILAAGAAYVPLDPDHPDERLAYMLSDAAALAVVAPPALMQRAQALAGALPLVSTLQAPRDAAPSTALVASNEAYVIYTSGSTGMPKGVSITHANALNLVHGFLMRHEFASQRVLMIPPLQFDASVGDIFPVLAVGSTLVLHAAPQELGPLELEAYCTEFGVTAIDAPAALWRRWTDGFGSVARTGPLLPGLALMMFGGESVPLELVQRFARMTDNRVVLCNHYGPTEATVCSTLLSTRDGSGLSVAELPIGHPLPGVQVYVLDTQLQLVPRGVVGELCIAGAGVARGYIGAAEGKGESFVRDPFAADAQTRMYRSGDLVRWNADGSLQFLGRRDHQVKVRGFRIELGEIESAVCASPGVQAAIIMALPAPGGDMRLVAYVVVNGFDVAASDKEERQRLAEGLRQHLAQTLPEYMIPAVFMLLSTFPLTTNGKVDRKALPAPDLSQVQANYVAPRTADEQALCEIWQEVLGIDRVGLNDNFFELGGHSLLATRLLVQVNQRFSVTVPLKALFQSPTLAGLAQELAQLGTETGMPPMVAAPRDANLLPSYSQQRLWLLDQIDGGSTHYHMPAALKLTGALDLAAVNLALATVLERHESLRTSFRPGSDGQPLQVIGDATAFAVPVTDLTHLQGGEQQMQLTELVAHEASRPFDLGQDLMLRAALYKLAADEHVLLVTMHHIASDGWSMAIFTNEFSALYGAYVQGRANPLPPLQLQYADYAQWQRNWLQGEVLEQQLEYWTTQLADLPVVHGLPLDHARPVTQSFVGATIFTQIAAETGKALQDLCLARGATLFMGLHAAFSVLLSRYSNETDIVVGSPIANREQAEVAGLIGFFVSTLILRSDLSANPSFTTLLEQSKRMLLDAYAHQQVPFEQIVERLQPQRSLSHSPLFQVMLVLQNNEEAALELPGLTLTPLDQGDGVAKYDLTLNVSESAQGLVLGWEYNTDLFEAETIARMAGHFELLLASLLAAPDESVFKAVMLGKAERDQLLVGWNQTQADYPLEKCLHTLFEEQAARDPQAVAIVAGSERLSYGELNARANRLAHHLLAMGVQPDDRIAICAERGAGMIVAMLATLKAGAGYVPLDPAYPADRLAYMLQDSAPRAILTQGQAGAALPPSAVPQIDFDADTSGHPECNPVVGVHARHLAYIIYTSGSTGMPKGVMIEHANAVNFVYWSRDAFDASVLDKTLLATSLNFDLHVYECFVPLSVGASVTVVANALALLNEAVDVSLINTVPSAIEALVDAGAIPSSVRAVNLAGEALKGALVERIFASSGVDTVCNLYGPSETTTYSTWVAMPRSGGFLRHIGRPVANTTVYLLDAYGQPVPTGVAGEIYIGGAGVARGYLNRPDLSAERFLPDPFTGGRMYRTGDLGRYVEGGNIEYRGRIDHQVKIRGFRIELGEIEHALTSHAQVRDAVVLARQAPAGDMRLVAYAVVEGLDASVQDDSETALAQRQLLLQKVHKHISQTLPEYMMPSAMVLLDALPLTPNGKLDRKALPEPDLAQLQTSYVAPRTPTEVTLCGMWQGVLGIERVGITDNFFLLGGHSLSATRLAAQVNQGFGITLALKELFQAENLSALASLVDEAVALERNRTLKDATENNVEIEW